MRAYVYQWGSATTGKETIIHGYGLTPDNKTIRLSVTGFNPYIYMEVPAHPKKWWKSRESHVRQYLGNRPWNEQPVMSDNRLGVYKFRRLYNQGSLEEKSGTPTFSGYPFFVIPFSTIWKARNFFKSEYEKSSKITKRPMARAYANNWTNPLDYELTVTINQIGTIPVRFHGWKETPELQFQSLRDLPSVGWISFPTHGAKPSDDADTLAAREYECEWGSVSSEPDPRVVSPLVMSFDIEVNSSKDDKIFPSADCPGDVVICIACVLFRAGAFTAQNPQVVLLTLGEPSAEIVGADSLESPEIRTFKREQDLLLGFSALIQERNPQIVTGYNILGFDLPYMDKRARNGIGYENEFRMFGMEPGISCRTREMRDGRGGSYFWYRTPGRLWVDLYPILKSTEKLSDYRLDTVAKHVIGPEAGKLALTPSEIFAAYRSFTPNSLGQIGRYCVWDAWLPAQIFDITDQWAGLTQMADVASCPIEDAYIRGYGWKTLCQLVRLGIKKHIVIDFPWEEMTYDVKGARVLEPMVGLHKNVAVFDFNSLYPSIIIEYNLDYATVVPDESKTSDKHCRMIEWDEDGSRYRFKFLREPRGVIPDLCKMLLTTRKEVKAMARKLRTMHPVPSPGIKRQIAVLDKRQLAYKICANAIYGATISETGMLPCPPIGMCTTAMGREAIKKASEWFKANNFTVVGGDTDSCMVRFDEKLSIHEVWDRAVECEHNIARAGVFPDGVHLEFENLFRNFMIMKKKMYVAEKIDRSGRLLGTIQKGVVSVRRDYSIFLRDTYNEVIKRIFNQATLNELMAYILERFERAYTRRFLRGCSEDLEPFVITTSIRESRAYKNPNAPQALYASRLERQGLKIGSSMRIRYVLIQRGAGRLGLKWEDPDEVRKFRSVFRLDYTAYVKRTATALDSCLECAFGIPNLISSHAKLRELKSKILQCVRAAGAPRVCRNTI